MCSPEQYIERGVDELYKAYCLERNYQFGEDPSYQILVFESIKAYNDRADFYFDKASAILADENQHQTQAHGDINDNKSHTQIAA